MPTVSVKEPVFDFLRRLAPEPRQTIKRALKELTKGRGDIRSLEQRLTGYYRLRAGKFRVVFRYTTSDEIEFIFAEERSMVYEVFESQFISKLRE